MMIQKKVIFFKDAANTATSTSCFNGSADTLALSIKGILNSGSVYIEGHNGDDWISLAAVNLTNFSVSRKGLVETGIYEISILSVRELRCRIEEISGSVTIEGELISSSEV